MATIAQSRPTVTARATFAAPPPPPPGAQVDPDMFAEVDDLCLAIDKTNLQLADALRQALVRAALYRDRELIGALRVAFHCVDDHVRDTGELGLVLLGLRDALFPEGEAS